MKPIMSTDSIKVGQTVTGWLTVNGRKVGSQIQTLFNVCTDSISPWRADARERFLELMADAGKETEGKAIIRAIERQEA